MKKPYKIMLMLLLVIGRLTNSTTSSGQNIVCATSHTTGFSSPQSIENSAHPDNEGQGVASATQALVVPSGCSEIVNIRVNVHFMLQSDGRGNFNERNDGHPTSPNSALSGYEYAEALIGAANDHWNVHPDLSIPASNGTAVPGLPKRIRLLLTGVYFHRDDSLRVFADNINPSRYSVNPDSVINIYLTEVALNQSTGLPAVSPRGGGVASYVPYCAPNTPATGLWTALLSPWSAHVTNGAQAWQFVSVLNHEIGHLLGLQHAYYGFQCEDAPANSNCWNLNEPPGPNCDAPSKVSNNLMDYNASQVALSPCQLGIIRQNLNSCLRKYVHSCSNCLPAVINFTIEKENAGVLSDEGIILEGRSSFGETWFTLSIDKIDKRNNPVVGTHFEQTYQRQLGRENLSALYTFYKTGRYQVQVSTSSCLYKTVSKTVILEKYAGLLAEDLIHSEGRTANFQRLPDEAMTHWVVYPNPTRDFAQLQGLPAGAQVWLLDMQGRIIRKFKPDTSQALRQINLQNIQSGTYLLKVEGMETFLPPQRLIIH